MATHVTSTYPPYCLASMHFTMAGLSPPPRSGLKLEYASQKAAPFMPLRIGGTRWVQHLYRALDNYLRGYECILGHLKQVDLGIQLLFIDDMSIF